MLGVHILKKIENKHVRDNQCGMNVSDGSTIYNKAPNKRGCVFPMVIWPAIRMRQYRVNNYTYHAPQFIGGPVQNLTELIE